MNNLKIQNADYDLETGFFWIELDNDKTLQCCLKSHGDVIEGEELYFSAAVETDNNGFNEGMCLDVNGWAIERFGDEKVQDFIIEVARATGVQIVS